MARQGISKKQVFEAATALQEAGTDPTVQSVREWIGSGSYSTISNHLAEWRQEYADQALANIPDIPEKVMSAFQLAWAAAARSAQGDLETQRKALEAMRREVDKEKTDMSTEIKRLERELEETSGNLEVAEQKLKEEQKSKSDFEKQITDLRIECARFDERAKAAEGRADELKAQLESLQKRFTEMVGQKENERERSRASKTQDQ